MVKGVTQGTQKLYKYPPPLPSKISNLHSPLHYQESSCENLGESWHLSILYLSLSVFPLVELMLIGFTSALIKL